MSPVAGDDAATEGVEGQMPTEHNKQPPWVRNVRDAALFLGGLGGVFHEAVLTNTDRPTLLLVFAAMMGLPAFLRTDEKRK